MLDLHAHIKVVLKQILAYFLCVIPKDLAFQCLRDTAEMATDLCQIAFHLLKGLHR